MSGYGTYLNLVIVGLILIICRGPQLTAQEMVVPPSEDTLYQRLIYLDSIVKEMDKKLSERETEDELDALIKEAERLSSKGFKAPLRRSADILI